MLTSCRFIGGYPGNTQGAAKLAAGYDKGIGHEPTGVMTELLDPKSDLPSGDALTITARSPASFGTRGKPLAERWRKPRRKLLITT